MTQLEIQFFWPLTEQIPLDLDFTESINFNLQKIKDTQQSVGNYVLSSSTQGKWSTSTYINIDENNIVVKTNKEIPWYRSLIFKIIGIKLEKK